MVLLSLAGLEATDIAFFAMYVVSLSIVFLITVTDSLAGTENEIRWYFTFFIVFADAAVGLFGDIMGAVLGTLAALLVGVIKLSKMVEIAGP